MPRTPLLPVALLAVATAAHGATFQGIGDVPGGTFDSSVRGISRSGGRLCGYGTGGSGVEGYVWDAGVFTSFGDFAGGSFYSNCGALTEDGQIAVGHGWSASGVVACSSAFLRTRSSSADR